MRMRMSMIDVGMSLGDAIDPFQLANGFEAVIGYELPSPHTRLSAPLLHTCLACRASILYLGRKITIHQKV